MAETGRLATRRQALILGGLALGVGSLASVAQAAEDHPRIRTAISDLRDARAYLKAAPNNFGGHKATAIRRIDDAIAELKVCLTF
jgi:hypothetical protein